MSAYLTLKLVYGAFGSVGKLAPPRTTHTNVWLGAEKHGGCVYIQRRTAPAAAETRVENARRAQMQLQRGKKGENIYTFKFYTFAQGLQRFHQIKPADNHMQ